MTWVSLFALLRRVPREAWALVLVVSALSLSIWSIQSYGDRREAEGFRRATEGARVDSVLLANVRARVDTVQAQTDTIVRRVVVTRHRVDTLIRALPVSVDTLPEIRQIKVEVSKLVAQIDTMAHQLDVQKEARRMERTVMDGQLKAALVVVASTRDSLRVVTKQRDARVSKLTAASLFVVGAVGGVIVGVLK